MNGQLSLMNRNGQDQDYGQPKLGEEMGNKFRGIDEKQWLDSGDWLKKQDTGVEDWMKKQDTGVEDWMKKQDTGEEDWMKKQDTGVGVWMKKQDTGVLQRTG